MKKPDAVARISPRSAALALILPLALITVTGCSTVRSCGAVRSCGSVLQDGVPRAGSEVSPEGKFLGKADETIGGKRVSLRGRVMIYGNSPHETSAFVLEDGSGTLAFYPDSREREARTLQGKLVDLEAILLDPSAAQSGTGDAFRRTGMIEPLSWKIVN